MRAWSERLARAADWLEEHEWIRGTMLRYDGSEVCGACMLGAIIWANRDEPVDIELELEDATLRGGGLLGVLPSGVDIVRINDTLPTVDQREAVRLLREWSTRCQEAGS